MVPSASIACRLLNYSGLAGFMLLVLPWIAGCGPAQTREQLGVRLVGRAVDDEDVQQRGKALIGRPVSNADDMFGRPIDVFKDIRSERSWRTYAVKGDSLGRQRFVVEALAGKVVAISKAERGTLYMGPRAVLLKEKIKGKSPQECQVQLAFGKPLLEARSENTNRLFQLYQAGPATSGGPPDYCILRFDGEDRGEELEFVAGGVSTRADREQMK